MLCNNHKCYRSKCKTRFPIRLAAAATIDSVMPKIIFKICIKSYTQTYYLQESFIHF